MPQEDRNKGAIRAQQALRHSALSDFRFAGAGLSMSTRTAALFAPPFLLAPRGPKLSPVGAVDVRRIRVLRRCRRPSPRPRPLCGGRQRRRERCGSGRRGPGCPARLSEPAMPRNLRQASSERAAGAHPSLCRRSQAVQTQETCPAATCTASDETSQATGVPHGRRDVAIYYTRRLYIQVIYYTRRLYIRVPAWARGSHGACSGRGPAREALEATSRTGPGLCALALGGLIPAATLYVGAWPCGTVHGSG